MLLALGRLARSLGQRSLTSLHKLGQKSSWRGMFHRIFWPTVGKTCRIQITMFSRCADREQRFKRHAGEPRWDSAFWRVLDYAAWNMLVCRSKLITQDHVRLS